MKSRVMRNTRKHSGESVIFVSSDVKTEFYLAAKSGVRVIDFLDAVKYLKAKPEEQAAPFTDDTFHYHHVNKALQQYAQEYIQAADTSTVNRQDLDRTSLEAINFLRTLKQQLTDNELRTNCDILTGYINEGIYSQLPRYLKTLAREYRNDRAGIRRDEYKLQNEISSLLDRYRTNGREQQKDNREISEPRIIISETFI